MLGYRKRCQTCQRSRPLSCLLELVAWNEDRVIRGLGGSLFSESTDENLVKPWLQRLGY